MRLRCSPPLFCFLLGLAVTTGCSGGAKNLATVSGVVTHNGNPVDGARVVFHATAEVDGKQGNSYSSLTDSSGKYLIATDGKNPGIPAGVYKVTVTKIEGKAGVSPDALDSGQLDAITSDQTGSAKVAGVINHLPREYANPANTKLSATIDVGKNENINFALKGSK